MAPSTIRGRILARWTKHGRAPLTDPLTLRAIPLPCKITPLGLPPQAPFVATEAVCSRRSRRSRETSFCRYVSGGRSHATHEHPYLPCPAVAQDLPRYRDREHKVTLRPRF